MMPYDEAVYVIGVMVIVGMLSLIAGIAGVIVVGRNQARRNSGWENAFTVLLYLGATLLAIAGVWGMVIRIKGGL